MVLPSKINIYLNVFALFLCIFNEVGRNTVHAHAGQIAPHLLLTRTDCISYLVRFGYLDKKDVPDIGIPEISVGGDNREKELYFPVKLRKSITDFQTYAGLDLTGIFDESTKLKMLSPRCANSDKQRDSQVNNVRFQLMNGGHKWSKRTLTYKITRFSESGIHPRTVEKDIRRAFNYWEQEANLKFVQSTDKVVDIEILFARKNHRDDYPFDGKSGVLAHAFGPTPYSGGIDGDVHFDDDEAWASDDDKGTSLLQTAVHELGHSLVKANCGRLITVVPPVFSSDNGKSKSEAIGFESSGISLPIEGLSHSNVRNAIMYAYMDNGRKNQNFKLHPDDVAGIQYLYGKTQEPEIDTQRPTPPNFPTTNIIPEMKPDLCQDPTIDAITTINDGNIYIFKGSYYFFIAKKGGGIVHSRTARISSTFPGLPSNIDAAVMSPRSGRTFFFKGKYYWRFNGTQPDGGAIPISRGFPGIPDDVDTAFVWSGNQKLYFFKGSKYWMSDPDKSPPVHPKYPLEVSSWRGLPNPIDAAFSAPFGPTFFFKGGQYWRFDDKTFSVAEAQPAYPRSSRLMWFGCHKYRPDIQEILFHQTF